MTNFRRDFICTKLMPSGRLFCFERKVPMRNLWGKHVHGKAFPYALTNILCLVRQTILVISLSMAIGGATLFAQTAKTAQDYANDAAAKAQEAKDAFNEAQESYEDSQKSLDTASTSGNAGAIAEATNVMNATYTEKQKANVAMMLAESDSAQAASCAQSGDVQGAAAADADASIQSDAAAKAAQQADINNANNNNSVGDPNNSIYIQTTGADPDEAAVIPDWTQDDPPPVFPSAPPPNVQGPDDGGGGGDGAGGANKENVDSAAAELDTDSGCRERDQSDE
jgi:hypothetical protein